MTQGMVQENCLKKKTKKKKKGFYRMCTVENYGLLRDIFDDTIKEANLVFPLSLSRVCNMVLVPLSYVVDFEYAPRPKTISTMQQKKKNLIHLIKTKQGVVLCEEGLSNLPEKKKHIRITLSEPNSRGFSLKNSMGLYQKIFFNPLKYSALSKERRDSLHEQIVMFEKNNRKIFFLQYLVQNHTPACYTKLINDKKKGDVIDLKHKFRLKCSCLYTPNVSLWIPIISSICSNNILKKNGSTLRKLPSTTLKKEKNKFNNTFILENDKSQTCRKGGAQHEENGILNHCDKIVQEPRRETCCGDMILPKEKKTSFSKNLFKTKDSVISIGNGIRKGKKVNDYHLILCFGGKDMLALDWLPLLNVCYDEFCKVKKQKSFKGGKIMSRESGEMESKEQSYMTNKLPQQVSYFHSQWLQQKRYDLLNRRLEDHKRFLNCSITRRTTMGESMEGRFNSQNFSSNNSFKNLPYFSNINIGKYNFVLVDYPGYGAGIGQPCMRSCDDSGLEILRHCSALIHKPYITLHIIAYSVGCSIALRILILLIKFYNVRQKCRKNDPLDCIQTIEDLILISPFSNSIECINHALCVPKLFTYVTNKMWQILLKQGCIYNNEDYIKDLAALIKQDNISFKNFHFSIIVGGQDQITPASMGMSLALNFQKACNKLYGASCTFRCRCLQLRRKNHNTILKSGAILKILIKYHNLFQH